MTVHILLNGLALCGAGRPDTWPNGYGTRWTHLQDIGKATCVPCIQQSTAKPPTLSVGVEAHLTLSNIVPEALASICEQGGHGLLSMQGADDGAPLIVVVARGSAALKLNAKLRAWSLEGDVGVEVEMGPDAWK